MTVRFPITVELALGADISADPATWSWTDITSYVYVREGGVTITRGRADEQTQAQPSSCTLQLNNRDGRFTRLNPTGAYYGTLSKNTPVRVKANPAGGAVTRFVGFVSEWPPRWDQSENDKWVPVRADGVLRRLGQGTPSQSPLRRTILATDPVAYWPLEDDSSATTPAAAAGGAPMRTSGTVTFAAQTDLLGSLTAPTITSAALYGSVSGGSSTAWHVELLVKGTFDISGSAFARVYIDSGAIGTWRFFWPSDATDQVSLFVTNYDGGTTVGAITGAAVGSSWENVWHHIAATATQSGSDVVVNLWVDGTNTGNVTLTTQTLAAVTEVWANHLSLSAITSMAHIAVGDTTTLSAANAMKQGNPGEQADDRFARLCTEESVSYDVTLATSSEQMGAQPVGDLLALLRECEAGEEGLLVERLTGKLGFNNHVERYNLTAALTLDYATGQVHGIAPTDDDQLTVNDYSVTRTGALAGQRFEQTTGVLGTNPTTGAGRYARSATLNLYTDSQAAEHAAWRVRLGTINELRFPTVGLKLHASSLSSLRDTIAAVDIGERIVVQNLPDTVSYDDVDLVVEGYTERINSFEWDIEFNCAPYQPYRIATVTGTSEDNYGRVDSSTSTLTSNIASGATSCSVTSTGNLWSTEAGSIPFYVNIGGEKIQVTAVSGAASPQTFTITRSVNGVVKAHTAGDTISLWKPAQIGL